MGKKIKQLNVSVDIANENCLGNACAFDCSFWRKRKAENGDRNKEQLCLSDNNGHAGSDPNCVKRHSEKLTWCSGHVHVLICTN